MNAALSWALVLMSALLAAQSIMDRSSDATRPLLAIMALALAKLIDPDEKRGGR